MEPKKRIELSSSAWKAEVLTIIQLRHMAGVEGLEPTSLVLETKAQPLYQTPIGWDGRARTSAYQSQSLMTYQLVYIPIIIVEFNGIDIVHYLSSSAERIYTYYHLDLAEQTTEIY